MKMSEDKKFAASKLGLNCGQIYFGVNKDGFKFCTKLIEVVGDTLVFETKRGVKYFQNASEIRYLEPYTTRTTHEKLEVV